MPGQYSSAFISLDQRGTGASAVVNFLFFFSSSSSSFFGVCGVCGGWCLVLKNLFFVFFSLCAVMFYDRRIYTHPSHLSKGRVVNKTHQSVFCHRDTGQGRDPLLALLHLLLYFVFFFIFLRQSYSYRRRERYDFWIHVHLYTRVCEGDFTPAGAFVSPIVSVCARLLGCNQFFFFFFF